MLGAKGELVPEGINEKAAVGDGAVDEKVGIDEDKGANEDGSADLSGNEGDGASKGYIVTV